MRTRASDLIGKKFTRLVVLEKVDVNKPRTYFKCKCECGNEKIVSLNSLTMHKVMSCGCLAKETKIINGKLLSPLKYGIDTRKDDIYKTYARMMRRCHWKDTEKHKKYYATKGIKVCDEWRNNYLAFKKWAIENGYRKGLSIDRINPNDDYKPSNCRFITISENSKIVEHKKGVFCLTENQQVEICQKRLNGCKLKDLAKEYSVSMTTIWRVLTLKERDKNENQMFNVLHKGIA